MWRRLAIFIATFSLPITIWAEPAVLTLPQVDSLAGQALEDGQPRLAYDLSKGLLQADPRNPRAHYYQALALAQVEAFGAAQQSAAEAYRHSNTDEQRYQAANLAAQLSFADDRLTGSQLWLRRAVQYAPDETSRDKTISAYRNVRYKNPLHFNFQFSITPSDNVNNGSNSPLNVIDGVPFVGTLSPAALALSGLVTTAEVEGSYRIFQGEKHETHLTGGLYTRHVSLSDPTPGLSGKDLSSTIAEVGVREIMLGTNQDVVWQFDVTGGRTWYGGDPLYDFVTLGAKRQNKLRDGLYLTFGGEIEQQQDETNSDADTTQIEAFGEVSLRLKNKSNLAFRLQYRDSDSDGFNRTSQQWSSIASYSPGKQLGPAQMSFSLGYSTLEYDDYRLLIFTVPGGRRDESVFGSISATFKDWSYLGFVPTVSLTSEQSRSNVSRFDVDETSVTLGIRSEF